MKVFFLNPPFKVENGKYSRTSRSPAITKSGTVYYPIWLAYAAGNCEKNGHEVKLFDSCSGRVNLEDTLKIIIEFNPDIVVLDTSTPSIINDLYVSKKIKEKLNNKALTVLMGTHPSSLPDETLKMESTLDIIMRGEADQTDRQTDRQTETNTQTDRDGTETHTQTETRTQTDRDGHTDRQRRTHRQTETDRDRQRQAETDTQTDKAGKQASGPASK